MQKISNFKRKSKKKKTINKFLSLNLINVSKNIITFKIVKYFLTTKKKLFKIIKITLKNLIIILMIW